MNGCPAELLAALQAAGLAPVKDLDLAGDGTLTRYRGEGDKPGARNCWVVFHGGQYAAAMFGSWRTGFSSSWQLARPARLTPAENAAVRAQSEARLKAHLSDRMATYAAARERACELWSKARPATNAHAYLKRKQVHAFGLRQLGESLLIPVRNVEGEIQTMQFIAPDGTKRFLTGGKKRGGYFAIGRPAGKLLLCEGYATAATLHMATQEAVAVAFDAGNLLEVAKALRAKFPAIYLVVCADNDRFTPGNPGVTAARAAARAVGGVVAIPRFADGPYE